MSDLASAMLYATLAGATIPLGGFIARIERIRPAWLENEFRHSVIAFGGGILIAAIALVLVPEGIRYLTPVPMLVAFGAGGLIFLLIDRAIEKSGASAAQLIAMLIDFIPESLALGALLATDEPAGFLLALLIALQNLPESFNAYREVSAAGRLHPRMTLTIFCALVPLGPLAALIGFTYLHAMRHVLGTIMLFASGGILYLTFQDIAPRAKLEHDWAPALGAVAGFMLGLLGHVLLQ